ncbi:hypothetical protein BDF19DRAFT_65979 [Syncephalis fuscata]|nr:hypothetical protein BDF19DRAFT_65979 [Syncephalis fuscata]
MCITCNISDACTVDKLGILVSFANISAARLVMAVSRATVSIPLSIAPLLRQANDIIA